MKSIFLYTSVLLLLLSSCATKNTSSKNNSLPISIDMWLSTNEIAYDKALIAFLKVKNNSNDTLKLTKEGLSASITGASPLSGIGSMGHPFSLVIEPNGAYFQSINIPLDIEKIKTADDTIIVNLVCKINDLQNTKDIKCQVSSSVTNSNRPDHLAFIKILDAHGTTKPIADFLQTDDFQNSKYYLTVLKLYLSSIEYYELNFTNETAAKFLIAIIESGETDEKEREFRLWQLGQFYCKTPLKDKVEGFVSNMKKYQEQAKTAIAACKTKQ